MDSADLEEETADLSTALRSCPNEQNQWVPHIWPDFGQMWEGTDVGAKAPIAPEDFQGEISEFPHLAKTRPDMGHPRPWYRNIPPRFPSTPTGDHKVVDPSLNLPQGKSSDRDDKFVATRRRFRRSKRESIKLRSASLIVCIGYALGGHGQTLPEGKGKAEFQKVCGNCHSVSMATSQRMDQAQWTGVVNDMVGRGAQGTQQDFDNIIAYLTANFGAGKPATAAVSPSPANVPATAPLSEAEIAKATGLMKANGCLSCHRIGDMGSYVGPNLSNIGASRSAEDIQAALVSPGKDVRPENRSVRLVTKDGKVVTGRILNHDGFSVQIIDSESQLRSFQKANLREFTIVTANPMPSYADKMSTQDITGLVHYLSSLKGSGDE
jgi:putative heme-binding domain-containing protein